jgi:hypothetical protein
MSNGKHRITKERAERMLDGMKAKIANHGDPLSGFPEGFIFDIEAVRKLISHPRAAHFIIRFGWNEDKAEIAPVLCVADSNKNVLEKGGETKVTSNIRSLMKDTGEAPVTDEDAGGYLDEGTRDP